MHPTLPNYSMLIVRGDPTSIPQAAEILIRTQDFSLPTSSGATRAALFDVLRASYKRVGPFVEVDGQTRDRLRQEYRCLPLLYLRNQQIVSSHPAGPHGWINWNGTVSCENYNLGWRPTITEVAQEWKTIATTWPFLSLRCQLFSGELAEMDTAYPLVEFRVEDGSVTVLTKHFTPFRLSEPAADILQRQALASVLPPEFREVGRTVKQLQDALQHTRHSLGLPPLECKIN